VSVRAEALKMRALCRIFDGACARAWALKMKAMVIEDVDAIVKVLDMRENYMMVAREHGAAKKVAADAAQMANVQWKKIVNTEDMPLFRTKGISLFTTATW
jgi:hypothetical protein